MDQPIGLFIALAPAGRDLSGLYGQFSTTFAQTPQQLSGAVVCNAGALWRTYETTEYHFFIEGDVFFRGQKLQTGINNNEAFVREFDGSDLSKIKGNFNAVIIGKRNGQQYIITGGLGLKPLFSHTRDGVWYFGDDLRFFRSFVTDLVFNELALAQLLLFNFPIGSTSFLQNVDLLTPGSVYASSARFVPEKWYDPEASITQPAYSSKASLDLLHDRLNAVVDQYISGDAPFGVSLTGGFDGRTILSAIRERSKLQVYTFGSRTSSDIRVARQICEKMSLQHSAFYIDEHYYDHHFLQEAEEFIARSNGIGTYERTHYLHAFKQMSDEVGFLLTGNAGSEIFRTIVKGGILVPKLAFDLLTSEDSERTVRTAIEENVVLKALNIDPQVYVGPLVDSWRETMGSLAGETDSYRGVYRFFLKETLRKWFGTEMRVENKYCPNRAPFIDEEFLEALHQTPFSVAYQPFLSQNPVQRKMGQTTYSHIMVRNDRKLAGIKTSRGYAPKDVISVLGLPRIAYSYLTKKRRTQKDNDYNQFETARFFFDHYLDRLSADTGWLNKKKLLQYYDDPDCWRTEIRDFSRVVCLGLWYQGVPSGFPRTKKVQNTPNRPNSVIH